MTTPARWVRCLPAVALTAAILWASGGDLAAEETRRRLQPLLAWLLPGASPAALEAVHLLARKAGHASAYGLLAALWSWALGGWRRALALAVATAFLDELHQATLLSREGSAADILLDAAGAAAALALRAGRRAGGRAARPLRP